MIADLGAHVLDLVHHLVGDLDQVLAVTQIAYPDRPSVTDPAVRVPVDAEDSVKMLLRARSGATGTIEASKIATGTEDELRFEIHGARGALRFNSMDPHHLQAYDAGSPDRPAGGRRGWTAIDTGQRYPAPAGFPGPKFVIGWLRSHVACLAHFLDCVAAGRPAEPGLAQGIYVQRLIECARLSAASGRWTRV